MAQIKSHKQVLVQAVNSTFNQNQLIVSKLFPHLRTLSKAHISGHFMHWFLPFSIFLFV